MSKLIKNIAFAIMVTLLTVVSTNIAFAEETEDEPKKELVLYSTDDFVVVDETENLWVGLRYLTNDDQSCVEISYNGKSLTSLIEEGYTVEMKAYEEYPPSTISFSE